jgi:hypothetical protein
MNVLPPHQSPSKSLGVLGLIHEVYGVLKMVVTGGGQSH